MSSEVKQENLWSASAAGLVAHGGLNSISFKLDANIEALPIVKPNNWRKE